MFIGWRTYTINLLNCRTKYNLFIRNSRFSISQLIINVDLLMVRLERRLTIVVRLIDSSRYHNYHFLWLINLWVITCGNIIRTRSDFGCLETGISLNSSLISLFKDYFVEISNFSCFLWFVLCFWYIEKLHDLHVIVMWLPIESFMDVWQLTYWGSIWSLSMPVFFNVTANLSVIDSIIEHKWV